MHRYHFQSFALRPLDEFPRAMINLAAVRLCLAELSRDSVEGVHS